MQIAEFEAGLREALAGSLLSETAELEPDILRSSVQHLLGGGKLFRPMLALATRYAITGEPYSAGSAAQKGISVAATIELVHTFTLIHDDLPCMDDAQLRRGLPAVHRQFGEAMAVLAGDDLLTLAFSCLAQCRGWLGADAVLDLVETLATATHRVVQGQVEDIGSEGRSLSLQQLENLHRAKTGALIGASCRFGGILAGGSSEMLDSLSHIGEDIGLAFQIRDDLLSLQSDEDRMGKTLSTDIEKQKSTFPRLLGVSGAQSYAEELVAAIHKRIADLQLARPQLLADYASLALQRHT
ncbi:polyprenyl synthetase family protein [bacterium]|nr:polyprenyl synthetase family protein [bacterium]